MVNRSRLYIIGRVKSFGHAFRGLAYATKTQKNIHIHMIAAILVLILGVILKISYIEFSVLILCITIVWVTEIINTAIETLVDLCSPDYHDLARISKDLGAAAVLVAAISSATIGCFIFIPHLILFWSR